MSQRLLGRRVSAVVPAFELNGVAVEREHFYAIACDPTRSVAVEACAGAGKTWMLVSRMVRALVAGSSPQNILAITFTKKAAGEMRQRLHEWLVQFACASDATLREELRHRGCLIVPDDAQIATLRALRRDLLRAGRPVQIRTFHSWFAALLRSAPLSALQDLGFPMHYELLDSDDKAVARTWGRFQTRVAGETAAREDYLAAVAAHGRHQTHKALEAALAKRVEFSLADAQGVADASVDHFARRYPDFDGLQEPLERLRALEVRGLLLESARILGGASQITCKSAASALEQAVLQGDTLAMLEALLTKTQTPRKFSDKVQGIGTVREAQGLLLRVVSAGEQHAAWLHQQRMVRLTRILVAEYADLKRESGWVDMGDLERAALMLMSDPVLSGWVQERLDAQIEHVLIDEFQDTNPLQWQALSAWLSSYAGAGRAPSVFLVGDPKQSIYRFRRAEPQVFKAAQRFVREGLGGDLLSCDHTRRNAPAIMDLVNGVMGQAQSDGEFSGFRDHSTESTATGQVYKLPRILRHETQTQTPVTEITMWRDSLTAPRRMVEESGKALESQQAARWVAQQLRLSASQLLPKDVLVLARKRERLGLMQAALAALDIPALQPEKTELGECPEVQDVVALLDVLVSPAHDLSLARVLKSPLFGIGDADLVQLVLCQSAMQEGRQTTASAPAPAVRLSWWEVLHTGTDLAPALTAVGPVLLRWKTWVDSLPPHDALSAVYHDGDVLARYAATTPATQRESVLANLRAVIAVALQVDGGRYVTPYGLVRALRAGGVSAPLRADANAVRLLTIHGAKGLEARLVLMLDTDSESQKAQSMGVLVDWPGESCFPQRFVFLASESRPPACVVEMLASEQTARRREEINALYVALTRTQQTLVLSSLEPHSGSALSWWQRLQNHATEAPWCASEEPALALAGVSIATQPYPLLSLPIVVPSPVEWAQAAVENEADSVESRVGQAMHRLLEWVTRRSQTKTEQWTDAQRQTIAGEFQLEGPQVALAERMALTILDGEGLWVWDTDAVAWAGNEVAVVCQTRMLRIDRLVQRRDTGDWWVLDYKSAAQPQNQTALQQQLLTYRKAVAQLQPGQRVRAAFLTAQGLLIEVKSP